MNDIARQPLTTVDDAASAVCTKPVLQSVGGRVADPPSTAADRGVRLTWRKLDRVASAATLGMVLVSPRTALLMARMLGPRIPPSAPASPSSSAATRRREIGR
jgi:hypothetical protein